MRPGVILVLLIAFGAAAPAAAQSISKSWQDGPPRTNSWSRPMDRFETPAQRRAAITRGERDYQPPAFRERDPPAVTGLSGPPPELESAERKEPEERGLKRVSIFDRDRPWRAPRPVWYPAPEQEIPAPDIAIPAARE